MLPSSAIKIYASVVRYSIVLVAVGAAWAWAIPSIAQDPPARHAKQIVILYTHRTLTPINADWDRGIRSALAAGLEEPLDIEIEYLNLVRHKDPDYLRGWIELLKTKYATKPPDLVIPVYVPALAFTLEHRESIFPNVPIVFCSAPLKVAERAHGLPKVTGVAFRLDIAGTVETARRLHPANNRLMILIGSSDQERALMRATQEAILSVRTKLDVEYVEGLSPSQLLAKVATADRNTSILMLTYDEDSDGIHYSTVEIMEQLSAKSSAPIYGLYDTLLGHGIVGGSLQSAELQGKLAGGLAVRVLQGERPEDLQVVGLDTVKMQFDARQLQRWNIDEAGLPPRCNRALP